MADHQGGEHQAGIGTRAVANLEKGTGMKLPRRKFLHLAAGAAALPAVSRVAWAQAYPSRLVRLVVGAPAGGGFDIVARLMGQWLRKSRCEAGVRAPADGYAASPSRLRSWAAPRYDNITVAQDIDRQ